MQINISPKLFTPLYWHLEKYMRDERIRYIFIYGGSSAAKTYSIVQRVLVDTLAERESYIVLRKYGSDIEDSIYSDFAGVISTWSLDGLFREIKNKIHCGSGGYIRFRGLDDSEKIKGIARFKRVIIEEMTQFEHEDFKQIRKRLRGKPGQQIIGLWNPVSEEHWIKKEIIDHQTWNEMPREVEGRLYSTLDENSFVSMNQEGNTVLIRTTYKDNYWIVGHPEDPRVGYRDEHVLADYEADRKFDYAYYRVYALGEWGKLDTGAEFYKGFNPAVNADAVQYNPDLPIHLSFDENVNPYVSCTIYQAEGTTIRLIDEIALETPQNSLQHTMTEIKRRYMNHTGGIFIYGDATSRKADAKLEKGYNFFTLVAKELTEYQARTRVPLSNPSVMIRGMFINQIFQGRFPEIKVTIGNHCKKTIEDIRYVKEAPDGTKFKETVKDAKTGVRYEKYGHLSDTLDYFLCFYLTDQYNKFLHGSSTAKRIALRATEATKY